MQHALDLAAQASEAGEVPVGAVIVHEGKLLAEGWNRPISSNDPTAHAEIVALRAASESIGNYRLPQGSSIYVTLEPCPMCAGALVHARVGRVIYGAPDPRIGAVQTVYSLLSTDTLNHRAEVTGGVMEEQCAETLKAFFRERR